MTPSDSAAAASVSAVSSSVSLSVRSSSHTAVAASGIDLGARVSACSSVSAGCPTFRAPAFEWSSEDLNSSLESASEFLSHTQERLALEDYRSTGQVFVPETPAHLRDARRRLHGGAQETESGDSKLYGSGQLRGSVVSTVQLASRDSCSAADVDSLCAGDAAVGAINNPDEVYSLVWRNLTVQTNNGVKLLDGVSGILTGGLHALMSASGGGKVREQDTQ
jgi:hypothetical protein